MACLVFFLFYFESQHNPTQTNLQHTHNIEDLILHTYGNFCVTVYFMSSGSSEMIFLFTETLKKRAFYVFFFYFFDHLL